MAPSNPGRFYEAVGRRKTAVARVRLWPTGQDHFSVNGRPLDKYFPTAAMLAIARRPLTVVGAAKINVSVKLAGGGLNSQAAALAHGLSRALVESDVNWRPALKKAGALRRDGRVKERRKFGLKKARKAPQWSKR